MRQPLSQKYTSLIDQAHTDLIWWQRGEREQAEAEGREPVICPVNLRWVAIAESMGLVVDLATGCLIDGPAKVLS